MLLRVSAAFFSLLSLKYLYISFFVLSLLLVLLPDPSSAPQARGHPRPSLLPSSSPAPAVCSVAAVPFALSPSLPLSPSGAPLKLSGGLPSCLLCLVVLWWLPLLVHRQAQNAMTVGADAACICPRPDPLLPMCCRVSRWLFRGCRPSVRVCVLLPCVVWW